jgi:hypothetical protein
VTTFNFALAAPAAIAAAVPAVSPLPLGLLAALAATLGVRALRRRA